VLNEWQADDPDAATREVTGSAVFVDVAGFTAMSERLARKGKVGAEEVTDVLNAAFSELLTAAQEVGGSLIKFGGDALVIFFSGEAHAHRACYAAAAMRASLRRMGAIKTTAGTVRLRISIGVHSGAFHFLLAGRSHRELLLAGPAISRTVEMESSAQANEILISAETAALLPAGTATKAKGPGHLLTGNLARPEVTIARQRSARFDAACFVPAGLRDHLAQATLTAEHRQVTVAFVIFTGTDAVLAEHGAAELQRRLDALVAATQDAADEFGVCFLASDISSDGGKLILTGGAPVSTGDDEGAVLQAVRRIADGDYGLDVRVGVNRGHVFAGVIGPPFRRTYSVMGDAVNLAARVMAHANPGQVLATTPVVEHAHVAFETEAIEPFRAKGKRDPVAALSIGAVRGARERYGGADGPIVGRDAEIEALAAAAQAVAAGEGRVIEVVGEAGLGKSRLLAELKRRTDLTQMNLACEQYESSTAYFPFRAPVRSLLGISAADDIAGGKELLRTLRRGAPGLLPWAPLLALVAEVTVPATAEVEDLQPQFRRARLHEAVRELLASALGEPAALFVEDLHWADQASLDVLRDLVAGVESHRWLIIATSRPLDEPLLATADAPASMMRLAPVGEAEATKLASLLAADRPLPQHEVKAIMVRAGGNPLFLRELVAAAVAGGEALPDTVEAVITARIDRLPHDARLLLRHASVGGATVDLPLLREIVVPVLGRAVWPELRRSLEGIADIDRDALRFRHALFRDVAYESLPYRDRRRLHLSFGRAIEERSGDDQAELLSFHFYTAGENARAWRYSLLAGERSREKSANVEASEFYERALAVGRASGVQAAELANVCEQLGDVCELAAVYERAGRAYRLAKRYSKDRRSKAPGLLLKQGVVQERLGRYSQALRLYSLALRATRRRADAVRLRLAYAGVRFRQGKYADLERLARLVIPQAEAVGDRTSLGHAYYLLALAMMSLQSPGHLRYAKKALAIFRRQGDLVRQANVLNNMGIAAYYVGNWNAATDYYQRSREARERAGDVVGVATQENNIGEILSDQGRLDEAEERFQDALLTWRGARYPVGIALATGNLGRLAARRGDLTAALELLQNARDGFETIGATAFVRETQARVAEALVYAGEPEKALATLAGVVERLTAGTEVLQAAVHRVRGYALLQAGRNDEALAALETSLRIARAASADYETALTLEALAHARRVARTGDDTTPLIEAHKLFDRLGVARTTRVPLPPPME